MSCVSFLQEKVLYQSNANLLPTAAKARGKIFHLLDDVRVVATPGGAGRDRGRSALLLAKKEKSYFFNCFNFF